MEVAADGLDFRQPIMSLELAREIVMNYGWNSTCYQILNPGIDHWFSESCHAVTGYTRRHNTLLVAGAPVCPPEKLTSVCAEFEHFARRQGCRVCYVCAEERLWRLLENLPRHSRITLGAQPVWDPHVWPRKLEHHASLRAQLNRCRNKAVEVEAITPAEAARNPRYQRIITEWLETRPLPPMHFLVEPGILRESASERVVLVGRRHGAPVAFLVASPIAARRGYLVELLARTPAAPNGVSELLIDMAMRHFAHHGHTRVTLGLVALAATAEDGIRANPLWLRTVMRFARLHANRFYNFRGLEQFRLKMSPCGWEPVYAISTESRFSPRTLYSMGAAFAGIAPWRAVAIGAWHALRQELGRR